MGQITVERNAGGLEGLCVITPAVHADSRGSFTETYNRRDMEREGLVYDFVQDNQSSSARVFFGACTFSGGIRRPSSCGVHAARSTMLRWTCARLHPHAGSISACCCRRRITDSFSCQEASRTDSSCFRKRLSFATSATIIMIRQMRTAWPGTTRYSGSRGPD